ncbi:DUF4180 domain-containing protein [Archangium minus]|uniref:DUF4180 domain-containing protein n=1 Tax=Archangium minus TaxID=83450 RepID=A0ABY9X035_9BACT|nr:DUF4180 domain-containing protein [Archangium minus]
MTGRILELADVRVFLCAADGPIMASDRDAADVIGELYGTDVGLIAIPLDRLTPDFLKLRSRLAGEILQKFVTYRFRVALLGDIAAAVEVSDALRDFVRESNRGETVWFVRDLAALEQKLKHVRQPLPSGRSSAPDGG